ncbi:B12-binding domain-containing radical SAM protein [Dehalococcoides mccartyi]|jgi:radical SAM superfamily enzyme YgiQ (UPF0313 family)|uniref:B12-binding domain-containing radical SAM protein n=1 Tax=Dehalococcoides mccartyi TaxID=61435 RepID=UPI0003C85AAB|nr:B12-binding domain-containing radical SAM protein [Dehalococcoides mccartyi]AHB13884.1 radical SAM/B12-binding domain-containing protein [Dehalococcoides mccartyi GY50]AII58237.1 methyltransferase [Dehalococcoides mccartyi CG1]APH12816.1 radical SAM protein [Dehalococcoides mccartyi]
MKILLLYPRYPDTFWSFKHALKFVSKKASFPPLGLLTLAAMLPESWQKKLIDLNIENLTDKDILAADYVFISAMAVQQKSAHECINRCHALGRKVVAGGPYFTAEAETLKGIDHLLLGEVENSLADFVADLEAGKAAAVYPEKEKSDLTRTPIPLWNLVKAKEYSSMSLQYSRGCPFNCEFCDIVVLNGRIPRSKGRTQVLAELNALYKSGWRSGVFFVDDNFIGNKNKLKADILPAVVAWQKRKGYPFSFNTEVSINLADDDELLHLMGEAGFDTVFVGVETPNPESLAECSKHQNANRDMLVSIEKIQKAGMQVQGGFILGFDSDPVSIFRAQINFIQQSGIVTAMVGLLNAPRGTRLWNRLKKEKRLLEDFRGDNTDCSLNFVPRMKTEVLINGYNRVLSAIYAPREYYQRVSVLISRYHPKPKGRVKPISAQRLRAFMRSVWHLGILDNSRKYYWRLLGSTLIKNPKAFPLAITLSIYGYHFRKVVERYTGCKFGQDTA